MKTRPSIFFLLMVCGLFLTGLTAESVTQEQAIGMAENFVRQNGYTNERVTSREGISYELNDHMYEDNLDSLLNRRHNSLHPKAFCVNKYKSEWHVGFLAASVQFDKLDSVTRNADLPGKVVIVSDNGEEIRMAHKPPSFSHFTWTKIGQYH